jgi:predicted amidophosphoribosyltransferase
VATRRCSACAANWPTDNRYTTCPTCGEKTDYMGTASAMSRREALHLVFEAHYERREQERIRRGDPSPEEIGAAEARELIELERAVQ